MDVIQIVDWDKHYENNRTRELKRMAWVPMPNRHDGDGYTALLDHPNGTAHFGAWCALVEVASRCDVRGTLLRGGGKAHDAESLARMTKVPAAVWEEVLPRLVSIGWVRFCEIPQEGAGIPQEGAPAPHPTAIERNGTERKEGGRGKSPPSFASLQKTEEGTATPLTSVDVAHRKNGGEGDPLIIEMMQIHKKATGGVELEIPEKEMAELLALFRKHDGKAVVAAYRVCQEEKPGKPLGFFLDDFAMYYAKANKPAKKVDEDRCPGCGVNQRLSPGMHSPSCPDHLAAVKAAAAHPPAPVAEPDNFEDDVPGEFPS